MLRRDLNEKEDCKAGVATRECGYGAGQWYKEVLQQRNQQTKELMQCNSTSHAGDYDYDSDGDDDDTLSRIRDLMWILAPCIGLIGSLILVGIVCAIRRRWRAQRGTQSVSAAPAQGKSRALAQKCVFSAMFIAKYQCVLFGHVYCVANHRYLKSCVKKLHEYIIILTLRAAGKGQACTRV